MWTTLISVEELASRLSDPHLRILDCRHKLTDPAWGPNQYAEGHIPGAVHAHIDRDLSGPPTPSTGRHPLPSAQSFANACSRWGIDADTQVVVYDDAGGVWAARAWWLLQDYGHKAVAVLDGGLVAWKAAAQPITQQVPSIGVARFEGRPGHMPTVDAATLRTGLARRAHALVDARAAERFRGEVEPVDPVAGHIPGARSLPAVSLFGPDTRMQPAESLARRFDEVLEDAAGPVVAYCGSGVTASHLVLAARVAGRPPIALYPGSWSEWIRDSARPVETGATRPRAPGPKAR